MSKNHNKNQGQACLTLLSLSASKSSSSGRCFVSSSCRRLPEPPEGRFGGSGGGGSSPIWTWTENNIFTKKTETN